MAFVTHWNHHSTTASPDGRVSVAMGGAFGTHAIAGGGWVGGDQNDVSIDGSTAGAGPIIAQFPEYDSGTDTTYWRVIFAVPPGAFVRVHVCAVVEETS